MEARCVNTIRVHIFRLTSERPFVFHAITVFFQFPVIGTVALEPVHVYATYVAQCGERPAAAVLLVERHLEQTPARQRLHDDQVLAAAGPPVHPAPGRHSLFKRQLRAHVARAHGRPVLDQQTVQLLHRVLAAIRRGHRAAPVQFFVLVARAPVRHDARLFARSTARNHRPCDHSTGPQACAPRVTLIL